MAEDFMLPVSFEGRELEFPSCIRQRGFAVMLEVEIEGTVVTFEPDEERNWRAILGFEDLLAGKRIKRELLEIVAQKITEITQ